MLEALAIVYFSGFCLSFAAGVHALEKRPVVVPRDAGELLLRSLRWPLWWLS